MKPAFLDHMSRFLPGTQAKGIAESWIAPCAVIDAPEGWGEEIWIGAAPETVIAWQLEGGEVHCRWGKHRDTTLKLSDRPMALQLAGTPNHYLAFEAIRFAQFYIPDRLFMRVSADLGINNASPGMLRDDMINFCDDGLRQLLIEYMRRAIDHLELPSTVEMEARAILVVDRLLRSHHGAGTPTRTAVPPGGRDWRVRRAVEYLEARLTEDVGLAELAAAVDLSPSHVAALFKSAFGMPPHQWVMQRRVERVCELLMNPRVTITDAAFACGFASSQHMATVFRKRLGTTPTDWRRGRLG